LSAQLNYIKIAFWIPRSKSCPTIYRKKSDFHWNLSPNDGRSARGALDRLVGQRRSAHEMKMPLTFEIDAG